MANSKLNLNAIVSIVVNLSAKSSARKAFNLGLILGNTDLTDVYDEGERVRIYTSPDAMLSDGFADTSAEYKAALLYFGASTSPQRLAVGRTEEGESKLEALRACRVANSEWYAAVVCGASDSEVVSMAEYVLSAEPSTLLMYTTASEGVLSSSNTSDVFSLLKAGSNRRAFGLYCGDSNTPDAVAAVMGYAMGANTSTANSAYTLAYKTLVGVTPDDLSNAQVETICGTRTTTGKNGNVYITRAEEYKILQQGYMADKTSFDEILNLDMLKNELQLNVMDLLYQSKKIPQTEAGMAAITNVLNQACDKFVRIGFIAPGKWNGAKCLELSNGDYLPNGYLIQHDAIDDQPQAERDARIAPPFYVCCKLAGAIEFVTIEVNVNR